MARLRPPPLRPVAAALALAAATAAGAASPLPLDAAPAVSGGRLGVTLDLAPAFGPALERRFGNGLTNVVAIFVSVVPAGGGEPLVVAGRIVEVRFDVWDEAFLVTIRDAQLQQPQRRSAPDFAALRRLLADVRAVDLGPVALLPAGPLRIEAQVEVNPVSRELMQRTRELLASPATGRPGGGGRGRSVLGAMASYLLRDPEPGEEVVRFRSEPVDVPGAGAGAGAP
jgi:hypothetical protein